MKQLLLFVMLGLTSVVGAQTKKPEPLSFDDCTIVGRMLKSKTIVKMYQCGNRGVLISGLAKDGPDRNGVMSHWEFGKFWLGETADISTPKNFRASLSSSFYLCGGGDSESNLRGFMSLTLTYMCGEYTVKLNGQWGDEYQGNWSYDLQLGEVHMEPQWVDDPKKHIDFLNFQRWCPTQYGYRLCGWIDVPKVDHGKPAGFKR